MLGEELLQFFSSETCYTRGVKPLHLRTRTIWGKQDRGVRIWTLLSLKLPIQRIQILRSWTKIIHIKKDISSHCLQTKVWMHTNHISNKLWRTLWRLSALNVSFLMLAASIAAVVAESSAKLPFPAFCRRESTSFSQSNKNGLWNKKRSKLHDK